MDIKSKNYNVLKGYNLLLYFAGSMVMYEPNEECIVDFFQQGIIKRLPVASSNPNFMNAASLLREPCIDKAKCLKDLREDFNRLFEGNGLLLAPAYESIYKPDNETRENTASVSDFYNSYGWVSKYKGEINDDHLGVELLFLTTLVEKYLVIDDQVCLIEIRNEIRRFIEQHIFPWIPLWNEKMQQFSNTLVYKGIATLIFACVQDIYSLCDNYPATVMQTDFLKN
jgi:TorA maturation chaperone TorD